MGKQWKKSLLVLFYLPTYSLFTAILAYIKVWQDFPGGSVVKNLPINAGDMGGTPGSQEDPTCHTATTEAHVPRARTLQQGKTLKWNAVPTTREYRLLTATRESPQATTKVQLSQKTNQLKMKFRRN